MQNNYKWHKWLISDNNSLTNQNFQISREYSPNFCIEQECCLTWRFNAWLMSCFHINIAELTSIDKELTQIQLSSDLVDYLKIFHTRIPVVIVSIARIQHWKMWLRETADISDEVWTRSSSIFRFHQNSAWLFDSSIWIPSALHQIRRMHSVIFEVSTLRMHI